MDAALQSGAQYLAGLTPVRRARFMAMLAHNLTVAGRALYHSEGPIEVRAADLYALNEIQHRITSYASHALSDDEDTGWIAPVLSFIFEQENPRVRQEALWAWNFVLSRSQAVA